MITYLQLFETIFTTKYQGIVVFLNETFLWNL